MIDWDGGELTQQIGPMVLMEYARNSLNSRMLFHLSSCLQTVFLMTMGALGTTDASNVSAKQGIVAMLVLYSFSWSLGWAPLVYVLGAELPSSPLREMTLQIAYTVKLVTDYVDFWSMACLWCPC